MEIRGRVALEIDGEPVRSCVRPSPIGGTVTNAPDNPGMMAGAGTPLFVISDLSSVWVTAEFDEAHVGSLAVGAPVEVKKADLVLTVDVEGELAAVRSTEIGVPPVAEVDFKIAYLAPEGQAVKKGDSILRLDTEMVERQLAEKRAELKEAQKKAHLRAKENAPTFSDT